MPLPKPKKNEEKQPFISRCIAKVTKEDADKFPDRKQRAAICYSQSVSYTHLTLPTKLEV